MRKVTLVRGARQLLTLRGPSGPRRGTDLQTLGIIQDGAVLVADGRILEVGPTRRVENLALARNAEEIDASGSVVMPGFVDSHMQVAGGAPGPGRPVHEISPRALEMSARRAIEESVRNGTTAIEAKSGSATTEAEHLKILRVHAALRDLPLAFVSTFVASGAPLELVEQFLPGVRRRKLAEFTEVAWDEGDFASAGCRYLASACELGFGLKLNAGLRENSGAISTAVAVGAASVGHVVQATDCDATMLARSAVIATFMPSAMFHASIECSTAARRLIDRGAAVALATGYRPNDAPSQNMQTTIALACRMLQMTAAEAIAASTINAAYALRRAASMGSIESGKSADLIMLSVPDYRELPYHLGVNLVELVMSRGAVLVKRAEVQWPKR
jgi:imidazolonepropionase